MAVVFTADLQLKSHQARSRILPSGRNSRFQVGLDCLAQAAVLAKGGTLIVNGDLFDDRFKLDIDVLDGAVETIFEAAESCMVIISVGNHDQFLRDGRIHSLRMFQGRTNIYVVPLDGVMNLPDAENTCEFCIFPFTEDMEKVKAFVEAAVLSRHASLPTFLVLHEPVQAALLGNGSVDSTGLPIAALHPDKFEAVILGHYHRPQQILDTNVHYVGSPYQVDAGERGDEKRFLVWRDEKLESVPVEGVPRYIIVSSVEEARKYPDDFVDLVCAPDADMADLPQNVLFTPKIEEKVTDQAGAAASLANFDVGEAVAAWLTANGGEHLVQAALDRVKPK